VLASYVLSLFILVSTSCSRASVYILPLFFRASRACHSQLAVERSIASGRDTMHKTLAEARGVWAREKADCHITRPQLSNMEEREGPRVLPPRYNLIPQSTASSTLGVHRPDVVGSLARGDYGNLTVLVVDKQTLV